MIRSAVNSRHGVTPLECALDAKSAVRWLRHNAVWRGIDPDRLVAAGGSDGGHIAACTAIPEGPGPPAEDLSISSRPNALVLFNPVLRFEGVRCSSAAWTIRSSPSSCRRPCT